MNQESTSAETTTDFGYERVSLAEKVSRVGQVFTQVASRYDLMNDLMSGGLHRLWKRELIAWARLSPGQHVLDVASGTGDLAALIAPRVLPGGHVWMTDINEEMLKQGRAAMVDAGWLSAVTMQVVDAADMPFESGFFDALFCAFGHRNMADKAQALHGMCRVLKPGGHAWIMEFFMPEEPGLLQQLYDLYSFHVIPMMGECVTGDRASYQYFVESIRQHPPAEAIRDMCLEAGFDDCRVHDMFHGFVRVHQGIRYP